MVGSKRIVLRSPNTNTFSDCEVDDKIPLIFIENSGILALSGGLYSPIIITVQMIGREIFAALIS